MKYAYVGLYDIAGHVDKLNIRLQDILDKVGDHPSKPFLNNFRYYKK